MKHAMLICGCAALALAACSKKADTAGGPAPAASAPVAAAAPAAPPTRKAGLWEQTMSMPQMTQTAKICLDEATETKTKWWSTERHGGKSNCTEESVTPTAGGWTFHSVCNTGDGTKVTSDGTATGDFGSHYKVDVTSVTSGAPMAQANGTHKISIEASWKGPCPAGMKAGDIEMPGGMRISTAGGVAHMEGGPGEGGPGAAMGVQPGHIPSQAEIARMRAQAMDMAKAMKAQQGEAK